MPLSPFPSAYVAGTFCCHMGVAQLLNVLERFSWTDCPQDLHEAVNEACDAAMAILDGLERMKIGLPPDQPKLLTRLEVALSALSTFGWDQTSLEVESERYAPRYGGPVKGIGFYNPKTGTWYVKNDAGWAGAGLPPLTKY